MTNTPILYTFRRCPYAIRARMALYACAVQVEVREIEFRNKPAEMLAASEKATVPVLVLPDKTVLDESFDIMLWALEKNNSVSWFNGFSSEQQEEMIRIIRENDSSFKEHLDHYKYADRYPAWPIEHYREQGEIFLNMLDGRLQQSDYLFGNDVSLADIAVFPFVRQFAHVDKGWFDSCQYKKLQRWLGTFLDSSDFLSVMKKHKVWQPDAPLVSLY